MSVDKTLAEIDPATSRIVVDVDYRLRELVKAVPGARWDPASRRWSVPLSWPCCLALRAEFGDKLIIGEDLKDWAKTESRQKKELRRLHDDPLNATAVSPIDETQAGMAGLKPYQLTGAQAIRDSFGYLIMDEQGTGKTRTGLVGLRMLADDGIPITPCLIVAPKSVLRTWELEIMMLFPEADVRVCAGTPSKRTKAWLPGGDFYITTYDLLRRHSRISGYGSVKLKDEEKLDKEVQALGLQSIVADECHRIKNPKAVQTRAAWAAADSAVVRIALTGTPMQDTPVDMWSPLHFVAPDEYPAKGQFLNRYLDWGYNPWGGLEVSGLSITHGDEFLANLDARSRRVTKALALPFLPPKVYEIRWVELPPKVRKPYNDMAKSLIADLDSGTVVADSVLVRAGRLTQMALAYGEMVETDVKNKETGLVETVERYRMMLPSPKIDAFLEDLKAGDYDGQSVAIYCDSRQLADLLCGEMDRLKLDHAVINGSVSADDRQTAVERFQAGEVDFIVLTRAGSEGITLTRASTMVRLARSWSLTVHKQAEDRVHRLGSEIHDSIVIVDYVATDTVEEGQIVRLNAKEERAQEVLRDAELLSMLRGEFELEETT